MCVFNSVVLYREGPVAQPVHGAADSTSEHGAGGAFQGRRRGTRVYARLHALSEHLHPRQGR